LGRELFLRHQQSQAAASQGADASIRNRECRHLLMKRRFRLPKLGRKVDLGHLK